MLKVEDNERLVRVGPGTPAGELFRRYWQPALLSSELPEPDGAPVRVRMLGEDLIAFRDTEGEVGIIDAYCRHRRAPMFFGRNEECGMRCVYHGWKFNRHGECVDMPTEPPGSALREKARIKAYPTVERGGLVWTYMGPPDQMPPPPDYEWLRAPATHRYVSKTYEGCNYLQGLEGGLDTAHVSYLHRDDRNDVTKLSQEDGSPRLDVEVTDYGYYYVSNRKLSADRRYIRIYQYIMPAQQVRPSIVASTGELQAVPTIDGHLWVPIDDESTHVYNIMYSYDEKVPLSEAFVKETEEFFGRGQDDLIPGTFRLKRNIENDFLVDRSLQKKGNFSGVVGINTQDYALQEGMGKIVDRSKEFLGSSDKAIILMRRLMLEATRQVEAGGSPPGVHPDAHRNVRAYDDIVGPGIELESLLKHALAKW